jgi:hypothetical protein
VPVSPPSTSALDIEEIDAASTLSAAENACVASIPRAQMAPVPVFLHSRVSDTSVAALNVQADLMSQDVAEEMQTSLGAKSGDLPLVDSTISPLSVPAELIVIEHPDGSATRKGFSRFGDTTATALLAKAFDAVRAKGDGAIVWPDGFKADSIVVRLVLMPATESANGHIEAPYVRRLQFGVFRVLQPIESPAMVKPNQAIPRYPASLESKRVPGKVTLQFTVDTAGLAVPATISDVRPQQDSDLPAFLSPAHTLFVSGLVSVLPKWRFEPARIGPCAVRQIVQLPVSFEIH